MRLFIATLVLSLFGCIDQASFTPIGQITLTGPDQTLVIRSRGAIDVPISVERGTGLQAHLRRGFIVQMDLSSE